MKYPIGRRIVLNSKWFAKSISDEHLRTEPVLFISSAPYNDSRGYYFFVTGGSRVNSGVVYADEMELHEDTTLIKNDMPLYSWKTLTGYVHENSKISFFIDTKSYTGVIKTIWANHVDVLTYMGLIEQIPIDELCSL